MISYIIILTSYSHKFTFKNLNFRNDEVRSTQKLNNLLTALLAGLNTNEKRRMLEIHNEQNGG
jgi:hypothetical protein